MDELDYLVLCELFKDAQSSFLKIAKKLGVSSFTVKSRYDRMVEEGIIFKTSINIDLSKLGYQGKIFLFIINGPETPKSVTMDALKKIRNIIVITEIIGPFDILAIAPVTDLNSIRVLVNEVRRVPSVQRVHITCIDDAMFPINQTFNKVLSEQSSYLAAQSKRAER